MKLLTGIVKSNKMQKTLVVQVSHLWKHPLYKKRVKRTKRYLVHDEKGAQVGDIVTIGETKPISRHKRWVVTKIQK